MVEQGRVGAVETALYGEARAREEAVRRAAAAERAAKREAERARVQRARQWGDEEVRLLEKALDKFPQARDPSTYSLGRVRSLQWGDEEVRLLEKALDKFPQARRPAVLPRAIRSLQSCTGAACFALHICACMSCGPLERCGVGGHLAVMCAKMLLGKGPSMAVDQLCT